MGLAHHNFQLGSHLKPGTLLNWLDSSDESESEIEEIAESESFNLGRPRNLHITWMTQISAQQSWKWKWLYG